MGALLLAAGASGKRYALPNSRVMIHQPLGGFQGQATDIDIHAREILSLRQRLNEILARHTGQALETIAKRHRARQLQERRGRARVRDRRPGAGAAPGRLDPARVTRAPRRLQIVDSTDGHVPGSRFADPGLCYSRAATGHARPCRGRFS
jgi:hypothetical protein